MASGLLSQADWKSSRSPDRGPVAHRGCDRSPGVLSDYPAFVMTTRRESAEGTRRVEEWRRAGR